MTRTVSTIVTYHPKKPVSRRKAQAAAITGPSIVTATKRSARRPKPEPKDDAEADARVKAFFARMMRPPGAY